VRDSRDDINLKIERADKHLRDFRAAIVEFRKANPYGFRIERDPQTREPFYYVVEIQDIPVEISLIAGDVLQNLRSALDYLACALVGRNGKKPTKETSFPIFDDAAKYQSGYARKINGMGKYAINDITAIKPYKGGDDTLWRLHRLNNVDKHRLLFTAEANVRSMNTGQPSQRPAKTLSFNPAEWELSDFLGKDWVEIPNAPFPLKVGHVIFRDLPDAEF
jgi:hypothetical protein